MKTCISLTPSLPSFLLLNYALEGRRSFAVDRLYLLCKNAGRAVHIVQYLEVNPLLKGQIKKQLLAPKGAPVFTSIFLAISELLCNIY